MSKLYLGVDFGSSKIYVTQWDTKKKKVIPVNINKTYGSNKYSTESFVYYEHLTSIIVGDTALENGIKNPLNFVTDIKKRIVSNDLQRFKIPSIGKELDVTDVCYDIFKFIKDHIEKSNGNTPIEGIVLTTPVSVEFKQKELLKNIIEKTGLKVLKMIDESTAAALNYGVFDSTMKTGNKEKILVFDLGGGTFDITIFEVEKKSASEVTIEVLNTDGDGNLGGKNIDDLIFKKILTKIVGYDYNKIPEREKKQDYLVLMRIAKQIKENLSSQSEYSATSEPLYQDKIFDFIIKQEDIELWLEEAGFLKRINNIIKKSLDFIDLEAKDINKIILVGGGSNIPIIQKELSKFFNKSPEFMENPEDIVGNGAGLYCGSLIDKTLKYEIVPKVKESVFLKLDKKYVEFIKKNSRFLTYSDIKFYKILTPGILEVYSGSTVKNRIGEIVLTDSEISENQVGFKIGINKSGIIKYELYKPLMEKPFRTGEIK